MARRQQVEEGLRPGEVEGLWRFLPVAADHESIPGASHRDIEQPHRLGVAQAPAVAIGGEITGRGRAEQTQLASMTRDAVEDGARGFIVSPVAALDLRQVDLVELEALGGMDGHHGDSVAAGVGRPRILGVLLLLDRLAQAG